MACSQIGTHAAKPAVLFLAMGLGMGVALEQTSNSTGASSQDKQFLKDLGQDSNFEIKTAQLALQKSPSQDVKAYAHMLIADHTRLKQQVASADRVAGVTPIAADDMTVADHAKLEELKLLSGESFDKSYIKGLVKGNEDIQKEEKSEASDSSLAPVKALAARSAEIDTKHAEKAKQLAQAHKIEG